MPTPSYMRLRVNYPHPDHAPGSEVSVEESAPGVPRSEYWRRRLRDAVVDGCVEVVDHPKKRDEPKAPARDADGGEV